jgi:hypothetical protein
LEFLLKWRSSELRRESLSRRYNVLQSSKENTAG